MDYNAYWMSARAGFVGRTEFVMRSATRDWADLDSAERREMDGMFWTWISLLLSLLKFVMPAFSSPAAKRTLPPLLFFGTMRFLLPATTWCGQASLGRFRVKATAHFVTAARQSKQRRKIVRFIMWWISSCTAWKNSFSIQISVVKCSENQFDVYVVIRRQCYLLQSWELQASWSTSTTVLCFFVLRWWMKKKRNGLVSNAVQVL